MRSNAVSLGEISECIDYGVTASAEKHPVGPRFLRITDIQDGRVDWSRVPWCACPDRISEQSRLRPGDIVFARTGATTGKSFLIRSCPDNSVFASYLIRVRLGKTADPGYISHFFQSKGYWSQIAASARGVAQPGVNATSLAALQIPLPPLEEQRRIAAILDKAQRLEQHAEEQITKLDSLACSIFDQVISESRDSDAVMDIALGDLSLLSGQYGASCSSVPYATALPRYVRITDIQGDGFLSSAKVSPSGSPAEWTGLELEPGDLLFARSGATVGKTYMHSDKEGPCIFAGYLIRFRIDKRFAMPDYVYAFTRTEGYRKWVDRSQRTVAQPNINAKQYSELQIPLPSLEVQKSYCEKAKMILNQSDSCRQRLNALRNLKLSLASNLIKA